MITDSYHITKMDRAVSAARGLLYAQDNCPGEDLGQRSIAACLVELRAALKAIDEWTEQEFDGKAYLEELMK